MKITKEIFSKSFFSIAGGYDIQPLLRFSHVTDFFINVTLELEQNAVVEWYDQAFKKCNDIDVEEKIVINNFDETNYFELNEEYFNHLTRPDFISKEDLIDYRNTFKQFEHVQQYAVVYRIRRKSLNRKLTFCFCTAEGLASYVILSQNGKFAPYILSTIQTGVLEQPNGIMNRFYENESRKRPLLWIRGFEPNQTRSFLSNFNGALGCNGIYNKKALNFNSKWYCGWSYRPRQKSSDRYCKGFTYTELFEQLKNSTLKENYISNHHIIKLDELDVSSSSIRKIDYIVISRKTSLDLSNVHCNVVFWEDFTSNRSSWALNSAKIQLNALNRALSKLELNCDAILHIIPFCREDEGVLYFESLKMFRQKTITYSPDIFDFFDLKHFTEYLH
jgi:hypothetical protein